MKEFKGKVAVITGAASGIGRALAEKAAQEGMKIVLADVETETLYETTNTMRATGATVLPVVTDVSKASEIEALAKKTLDTFGAVHLLCNNAGVGAGGFVWESTLEDWEWVLGVNLWGVIHGVRIFLPIMLAQNTECHIINTASVAGLLSPPGMSLYNVTKHGIVTLSETLYRELTQIGAKVKVSVLCPGFVKTRIVDADRNRPTGRLKEGELSQAQEMIRDSLRAQVEAGIEPSQVADMTFNALREDRFYILTHPEYKEFVRLRMEEIVQERNPTPLPMG